MGQYWHSCYQSAKSIICRLRRIVKRFYMKKRRNVYGAVLPPPAGAKPPRVCAGRQKHMGAVFGTTFAVCTRFLHSAGFQPFSVEMTRIIFVFRDPSVRGKNRAPENRSEASFLGRGAAGATGKAASKARRLPWRLDATSSG